MSITTTTSRKQYTSTGGTDYPVDFYFAADSDLVVVVTDADGADTTLVLTTDYTVTGAGEPTGGTVTTNEAVTSGYIVTIRRVLAQTQATRLKTQGGWYPSVHEGMFDRLTMLVQQQQEEINRCLKYDAPTLDADIDTDISAAIDARDAAIDARDAATVAQEAAEAAQEAAEDAQAATEAALASAGIPTIGGNGGKPLFAKVDESGMEYLSASAARDALGLGTAAVEDVGTDPGNVVQLDEEGKLPAVDGSALTGLDPGVAPGTILAFGGTTPPGGYLECDGAILSRTAYAALFAAIGTAFGAGDGSTTFNLPDLRGEFVRGWDHGRGVDAGRALGSAQGDAIRNITGSVVRSSGYGLTRDNAGNVGGCFELGTATTGIVSTVTGAGNRLVFDASNVVPTAEENRPRNVALMHIIKY